MPASINPPVRRRRSSGARSAATARQTTALLIIDHERLQSAAWAEFHTARKRLEKVARDLHRHEETDVPEYTSWLHRTFPLLVTRLRELHAEVATKAQKVQAAQAQAAYAGGSLKRIWRQQREREMRQEHPPEDANSDAHAEDDSSGHRYDARPDDFSPPPNPTPTRNARDIYRRLVQRLHPDRGGEWTPKRKLLWHEVQQAWNAADADWLSRLEIDWEAANEVIGPNSPLSRLRRAIEELKAARRDTEQKLRAYRRSPEWRFTRNEKNRPALHQRIKADFAHDIGFLQRQLDYLNATIGAWEEDWTRSRPKPRRKHENTT
jgi:hypothetical protein